MGNSIIRFQAPDTSLPMWGEVNGDSVTPLAEQPATTAELLALELIETSVSESYRLRDLHLMSPLTRSSSLYCQGLNYAEHRDESGVSKDAEEGLVFAKDSASLIGANDAIVRPAGVQLLDYEIELGLVLRRDIDDPVVVSKENLGDYVAGLVICNDVSARDVMFGTQFFQWFCGKSYRTFCPAGPILYLLHTTEIGKIFDLDLSLKLNGEVRQSANTSKFIHSPQATLTALSKVTSLRSGDCLLTGTPGGVLAQSSPEIAATIMQNMFDEKARRAAFTKAQLAQSRFLEPGDVLELEIKSSDESIDLGKQRCVIEDERVEV